MKLFDDENDAEADGIAATAQLCVETGIRLVRLVRRAFRESPETTLTPARVRALAYLDDKPSACLSELAEHLIVGPPTASKLVDDLVMRGLLRRSSDAVDRRRLALRVTAAGRRELATAARPARDRLAQLLELLSEEERLRVHEGLQTLLPLLETAGSEVTDG